ncbi:RNA polymerase factor sigma-54 [Roseomonas sp. SSH11]|uniref:RNA polymerase sigma-54 factor n=1 Tax=Pararoseomonas baculiformis TaxID=2820812 RepID=A0ABS4AGY1_9PROT|nr:RNA polymerase factor sigma-54 [Pararoseomonas baculiformis]MBP0446268.1 RNA polymerase factor sigma-54 [Pararoseomonas baculiformis]
MSLGPRLDFRQTQQLVMTPQLRQAIKLLQSSNMEVTAFVEEELERNPLLEREESSAPAPAATVEPDCFEAASSATMPAENAAPTEADWSGQYESGEALYPSRGGRADAWDEDGRSLEEIAGERPRSLRELLAEQVSLAFGDARERLIAGQMIALLDPAGRLTVPDAAFAAALGCDEALVTSIRRRMQRFEPTGLFCADLRECLAVQLAELNRLDPAMEALLDNLHLLARRDMAGLLRVCGVDAEDLAEMVAEIRRLNPKPGALADAEPAPMVVPDVLMRRLPDGTWQLELNPETLPRVLVNRGFHATAQTGTRNKEDKAFLAEKLQAANWLVRSLEQRANTILRVAAEIVRRQEGFFRHGVGHLRPLILRDVADELGMHESTVSRVTANKYIATPRGTLELKYFFTTAIAGMRGGESFSAEAIRHRIRDMVDAETAEDILSDDAIVERLRAEGVDIARRTVAKYRDALRIPSSVQRKREKSVPAL